MNLSRPFGKITLGIIGSVLAMLSGALLFNAAYEGSPAMVGEQEPVVTGTQSSHVSPLSTDGAISAPATRTPRPSVGGRSTAAPSSSTVETSVWPAPTASVSPLASATPPRADQLSPVTTPTLSASPSTAVAPNEWRRVQIEDIGVAFEVPASWQRLGTAWAWSADGLGSPHVGFKWTDGDSPIEMMPTPSVVTAVKSVNLGWVEAESYQVEVIAAGSVLAVEKHVIFQVDADLLCDAYLTASSAAERSALQPILAHMLSSLLYGTVPDGPVEVAVRFLTALLNEPDGQGAANYLSPDLRSESPLRLLETDQLYSSFSVIWWAADDGQIQVQATLKFAGDRVELRIIHLGKQDGVWRIVAVSMPE